MLFHGIEKFSLVDFDGYTSCTLFTGRCNYRCPFCHNASLVMAPESEPTIENDIIFDYLKKRAGIIDAVCITGGEPTLHTELTDVIENIRSLGYKIKLDTNGTDPSTLRHLIEKELIDYVAMDIKNSPDMYPLTTGVREPHFDKVYDSAKYLISAHESFGFDFEFRTTVIDEYHTEDDFIIIGNMLRGAPKYFIQKFVDKGNCIASGIKAVNIEKAQRFADILKENIKAVGLRGYGD